jgi:predicted DNA-binding transcriptional regulator YafY
MDIPMMPFTSQQPYSTAPEPLYADAEKVSIQHSGPSSRRALNGTAYRIFKLLQWLIQTPLSVEALNQKFCTDPRIGKAVSNDSIWLYINTLKTLGCHIRRPGPKNNFQYELLSHPFGLPLSEHYLETLALAKSYAQQQFNHQEMLILDRLLKKVIQYSDTSTPQEVIDSLFAQSRSSDSETCNAHVQNIEKWLPSEPLLNIHYLSPVKGKEQFLFLPEMLYYEQGVIYLRGDRADIKTPSSLRVDRIATLEALQDDAIRDQLQERRQHKTEVRLRLFLDTPDHWKGFSLKPQHGVYDESHHWRPHPERPYLESVLQVRDLFYLKQKLLSEGFPFQIITPVSFQEDMQATLVSMLQYYQAETSSHGHG